MRKKWRKATSILLAAGMLATTLTGVPVMAAEEEHVPGFEVYYRDNDPKADLNVEVTSDEEVKWTIASCMAIDNPQSVNIGRIAEELSELTDGKFTWDVFYNSELGSETEAIELCRNNTVQFVTSNVTSMPTYVERIGVFALPYLFHTAEDQLHYLAESDISMDMWKELEDQTGLVTIGFQNSGARCLSTGGIDKIKAPEDLKGVKIRCMPPQVWQDVISALGATPVPIAYTEIYTAMQTGVVAGQDNPAGNVVSSKFYEVQDYFYETEHAYNISGFYTNKNAWDALPDDYKALLLGLCQKYLGDQYTADMEVFLEDSYKIMEDAGVTIVGQDELDMEAFYTSAADMIEEKYMSDEAYAPTIEDVKSTFGY